MADLNINNSPGQSYIRNVDVVFLDQFLTDRAAGEVDGSAAEPGPGTRTTNDASATITSGAADMPTIGGYLLYDLGLDWRPGRVFGFHMGAKYNDSQYFAWDNTLNALVASVGAPRASTAINLGRAGYGQVYIENVSSLEGYYFLIALPDQGYAMMYNHVANGYNYLMFLSEESITLGGDIGPRIQNSFTNGELVESVLVADVPEVADGDFLDMLAQVNETSPSAPTTYQTETNAYILRLINITLPSSGDIVFEFMQASGNDNDNCRRLIINSSGDVLIYEVIAATPTVQSTDLALMSNGEELTLNMSGGSKQLWNRWGSSNGTKVAEINDATFSGNVDHELVSLGTGGSIGKIQLLYLNGSQAGWPTEVNNIMDGLIEVMG